MASVRVDPELAAFMAATSETSPQGSAREPPTVENIRNTLITRVTMATEGKQLPDGMSEKKYTTTSIDGSSLEITRFLPRSLDPESSSQQGQQQRAVLYVHGGGTIAGSVALSRHELAGKAEASQTQYFAVDYRLSPEHPYPAALEDTWAAIRWLQDEERAASFGIDRRRIVLEGSSAGGLIAAGTALYARDHKLDPPLAGLLLMCPMLDNRVYLAEGDPVRAVLTWTVEEDALGWQSYLGPALSGASDDEMPVYAVPARARDLGGLPRTYIEVGGLDLFRDSTLAFASRMAASPGADVELHLVPGVTHAFEYMPVAAARASAELRRRFVESF